MGEWYNKGYDMGFEDGKAGERNKNENRYLLELVFSPIGMGEADYEEEFWDGYENGYSEGEAEAEEE